MGVIDRFRYVPAGYELLAQVEALGIEVYADKARLCARGFAGKRTKADFAYRFNNMEQLLKYVDEYIAKWQGIADYKAEQKAKRLEANRNAKVKVGDIFKASWGYEQTNVDYYQVVAVKGQMIDVRKIGAQSEGNGLPDQGYCVPVPNAFVGDKVLKKRIQAIGDSVCFKVASYANAYLKEPVAVIAGVPMFNPDLWTAYY